MTAKQERAFRLSTIRSLVADGRYADAYDLAAAITPMGRTHRWYMAVGALRLALHDAATTGTSADLDTLIKEAKSA